MCRHLKSLIESLSARHFYPDQSGHAGLRIVNLLGSGCSVVKHPLRKREVVGSNPGRAIPKALKMVPVATLPGAQHYMASTGFPSPNKYRTINIATLTTKNVRKKSLIITNVCIHRRTVWKIGSHAKHVILLKYRDYYYYQVQCSLRWF